MQQRTRQIATITGLISLYLDWLDDKENLALHLKKLRSLMDFLTTGKMDSALAELIETDENLKNICALISDNLDELHKVLDITEDKKLEISLDEVREIAKNKVQAEITSVQVQEDERPPVSLIVTSQLAQQLLEMTFVAMPILGTLGMTEQRWEHLQALIRPLLFSENDENQLVVHVPAKFAEKLETVLKIHRDQIALRARAANINANVQEKEMDAFIRKTTVESLQTLIERLEATDLAHVFDNDEEVKRYLRTYMEAGEIYLGLLDDIPDEELHQNGLTLTVNQYYGYENNFIKLLRARYDAAKKLYLQGNQIEHFESSVTEIAKVYSMIFEFDIQFPHATNQLFDQVRLLLNSNIQRLNFFSFKASLLQIPLDINLDTLQDRIQRMFFQKCAHLLERICDAEPEMYETETFLLKLLALYRAVGDKKGYKKTQRLIDEVMHRDILEPFEKLNQELALITGKPNDIVIQRCIRTRDFFEEHGEIFAILREIRARGIDSEELAQLHWNLVNRILVLTTEKIQIHIRDLINLYNSRKEATDNQALQESIYNTYESLYNDLRYLNKVNPDLYLRFFDGLSLSDNYRVAYSSHLISIIESLSKYVAELQVDEHIEMIDDLTRELHRLQNFYKYHFENQILPVPLRREDILTTFDQLTVACGQLNTRFLQLPLDNFGINDLVSIYTSYAKARALHFELDKRIPIKERELRLRLRYAKEYFQQCLGDIKNLISMFFDRQFARYHENPNLAVYDATFRAYYLLFDLNVPMKIEFSERDKEYDLVEDLEPLLSSCIEKLIKHPTDIIKNICDEAKKSQPLPSNKEKDDDEMRARRKLYQQCASLLVDCARFIYQDHDRNDNFEDMFANDMGLRLCRAILLYDCCSDVKQSENVQEMLTTWLREHLVEPTLQKLNYKITASPTSPKCMREQAATLFKDAQAKTVEALEILAKIRGMHDNTQYVSMHMQLAFKYLDCCCRAYIEGPVISDTDELGEVQKAFKQVHKVLFEKLPAHQEYKSQFLRLCYQAISMLYEQQQRALQSHQYAACGLLETQIDNLAQLVLAIPLSHDETFMKNFQLLRIYSKLNAANANFYLGQFGLAMQLTEPAFDLIKAGSSQPQISSSERSNLQQAAEQAQKLISKLKEQMQSRNRMGSMTLADKEEDAEPKVGRKNP